MQEPDPNTLTTQLQDIWYKEIPLSKSMELSIESFANNQLITRANLAPNVNVHGTAFAGSLYSVQALTGWGMMYLQTQMMGLDASILIAKGNIDYSLPVNQDIIAICQFDGYKSEIKSLLEDGKARFHLKCAVGLGDSIASTFDGVYVVKIRA
jgi:thioesterase domain-containing protein